MDGVQDQILKEKIDFIASLVDDLIALWSCTLLSAADYNRNVSLVPPCSVFMDFFPPTDSCVQSEMTYWSSLSFCQTLPCLLISLHPAPFAGSVQRGESEE